MERDSKVIEILFDYDHGPLFVKENGAVILGRTGLDIVDDDYYLKKWNKEASDLYSSCYRQDSSFDYKKYETIKPRLASYLWMIRARLEENNDGTFIVENKEQELFSLYSTLEQAIAENPGTCIDLILSKTVK